MDAGFYANRELGTDEVLPWDTVDIGIKKQVLLAGYEKAMDLIKASK
jgi:hypothetical protein